MKEEFKCSMCGECCRNVGKESYGNVNIIKDAEINLVPPFRLYPEKDGLHLYDFEYKRIKKTAEENGIKVNFSPFMVIFDLESNKCLVLDWIIEDKVCPFLKDNICSIHEKRALMCRRYPLFIQSGKDENSLSVNFNVCPNNKKNSSAAKLREYYGEIFDYAYKDYETQMNNKKIIVSAIKNKIIRPAVRYRLDFLRKRAENSEKISMFDFLAEKGKGFIKKQ